jgi:hypothetical protein
MATLQWRPEKNALTTPLSYWIRFIPRNSAGIEDLASDIAAKHPNFNEADILTILRAEDEAIQARLLNGEQVTKEGCCSWSPSFSGRLNNPDDPLPSLERSLNINVRISPPFVEHIRQNARTERLPMSKKRPLIATARATLLDLNDVLNQEGVLRLTGDNLFFDPTTPGAGCLIQGTRNGKSEQNRFVQIEPGEILLMPEIPSQPNPWNNEYTISVSTRYSEHGTLRTGTYGRMLRTSLIIRDFGEETGMLTGKANSPYVVLTSGTLSGPTSLRIRVVQDLRTDSLLFSLMDMEEEGVNGPAVTVTGNGSQTLSGFPGSLVSELDIRVDNYNGLRDMIRNDYSGMLTDVLRLEIEPT